VSPRSSLGWLHDLPPRPVSNARLTPPAASQVTVLGAAGGIGQPLSLLLKMNPLVSTLALYDIANTPGVAADLSHCNTPAQARARGGATRASEPTLLAPSRLLTRRRR